MEGRREPCRCQEEQAEGLPKPRPWGGNMPVCSGSKKGISVNNWGRGHVASKPLQPFGLSLELPHLTGFEGDPSCEDPHLPPK